MAGLFPFMVPDIGLGTPTLFVRGSETIIYDSSGWINTGNDTRFFDGDTTETVGSGSGYFYFGSGTDCFCGITFSSGKKINKVVLYGTDDHGYKYSGTPTITLSFYGKSGAAPTSTTDGTLLGSLAGFTDLADESSGREILSGDTTTEYDHVFARLQSSVSGSLHFGEIQIYTYE